MRSLEVAKSLHLERPLLVLEPALKDELQGFEIDRLADHLSGARSQGSHRDFRRSVGRHYEHDTFRDALLHAACEHQPGLSRQPNVRDHDVRPKALERGLRLWREAQRTQTFDRERAHDAFADRTLRRNLVETVVALSGVTKLRSTSRATSRSGQSTA